MAFKFLVPSEIFRPQAGTVGDPGRHPRADFIGVVKSPSKLMRIVGMFQLLL
jgi:hypothetical protein